MYERMTDSGGWLTLTGLDLVWELDQSLTALCRERWRFGSNLFTRFRFRRRQIFLMLRFSSNGYFKMLLMHIKALKGCWVIYLRFAFRRLTIIIIYSRDVFFRDRWEPEWEREGYKLLIWTFTLWCLLHERAPWRNILGSIGEKRNTEAVFSCSCGFYSGITAGGRKSRDCIAGNKLTVFAHYLLLEAATTAPTRCLRILMHNLWKEANIHFQCWRLWW